MIGFVVIENLTTNLTYVEDCVMILWATKKALVSGDMCHHEVNFQFEHCSVLYYILTVGGEDGGDEEVDLNRCLYCLAFHEGPLCYCK